MLVWIPGGAFVGGTAGVPLYDGARLAARGDVVVVTVNYRVGALGFALLDAERRATRRGREPRPPGSDRRAALGARARSPRSAAIPRA